ncbi:hypothetical protein [Pontibacter cellulosilyticus]|uniref:DUF4843 domain-containing protein n=1 Tax=Pontibacter cellulosilyticus TaxID=1720253 RepID=A0A923SP83_9BACT|nr:hypothetical protein [Pontibacter cellulosilyticus]MBC5993910.1 hypothetical protein [Pontibacter cellulosilyticus]
MKLFTKLASCFALLAAITLTSCEKEELELNIVPVNGVHVTLVPEGGGETKVFTVSFPATDNNGNTYGERKADDIILQPNTTYNATITYFSDITGTRTVQNTDITREAGVYSVVYEKGSNNAQNFSAELAIAATDKKADGTPLGLQATFTTGKVGIETLKINLNAKKSQGKSSLSGSVFNATYFVSVQH